MTQAALKKVVKEALVETLRENPRLLNRAVADAMEEVALAAAIRAGRKTKRVSGERVMRALQAERR
jgi:hypothetical protein